MRRATVLMASVIMVSFLSVSSAQEMRVQGKLASVAVEIKPAKGIKTRALPTSLFTPIQAQGHPAAFLDGGATDADQYARFLCLEAGNEYWIQVDFGRYSRTESFLVQVAVDGRDVITGDKIPTNFSSSAAWKSGMVVKSDYRWLGWRGSSETVRAFVATDERKSLAEQWNDRSAMGTIVIAVFRHRDSGPYQPPGPTAKGLGTAAGREIESRVSSTTFTPKPEAFETFVLRYASEAELRGWGVWKDTPPQNRLFFGPRKTFITFPDEGK
ncbi:MAG TPA: hypothetical protein VIT68_03040 [Candidatus Gracilibacteria bacterium]